jgi:transposase InsO family protein
VTSPRPAPNQRYVGDITYLPIVDGSNLYLATVIDCDSRRLAGWAIAEHMRTDLSPTRWVRPGIRAGR